MLTSYLATPTLYAECSHNLSKHRVVSDAVLLRVHALVAGDSLVQWPTSIQEPATSLSSSHDIPHVTSFALPASPSRLRILYCCRVSPAEKAAAWLKKTHSRNFSVDRASPCMMEGSRQSLPSSPPQEAPTRQQDCTAAALLTGGSPRSTGWRANNRRLQQKQNCSAIVRQQSEFTEEVPFNDGVSQRPSSQC